MPEPKHILVVVDPTAKEQPALDRAVWLAKKTGAAVELFICDYDQYLAGERFFDSASLDKARKTLMAGHFKRLEKLAYGIRADGLNVSVDAKWDHPLHEGIVRKATAARSTLVVKDTHYHPAIRRSIFSNTDWNLIRECPIPLLLVKPRPISKKISIIAAIDPVHERDKPADLDRSILSIAQELCDDLGGELTVLHAFDPSPAYAVSADSMAFPISAPINEMMDALKSKHDQAVDDLMQDYSVPADKIHVLEGDTRELLIALVEKLGASLVVMGAVARGAFKRFALGSTAELVLDRVPCDILIVKPVGFEPSI